MPALEIAGRMVGEGFPCFVIAEAGVNHNGSLETAIRLIDIAVEAGADAVKFQTFISERVVSPQAPKADYQTRATGSEESQLAMVKKLELPFDDFRRLKDYAHQKGILFLSTPFDEDSVDFLEEIDVPAYKIPSGEVINHPFLRKIAGKRRPLIMSTGMCDLKEVEEAVRVIQQAGDPGLVLLHCVSNYPADPSDINLRAMETMAKAFHLPVGFSDHTLGIEVALAAVALGACVIEKHFTLNRDLRGPDHKASLEPQELKNLVKGIRMVERSLGNGEKRPATSEEPIRKIARRSLVLTRDLKEGDILDEASLEALRPAGGVPPNHLDNVLGRRTKRPLKTGEILQWEDLA